MVFHTPCAGQILDAGFLKHSGTAYKCMVLGEQHLPAVMQLQSDVIADLGEEHKNYIVPKSEAQFQAFLSRKDGVMLGVVADGKLLAQGLLYWPKNTGADSGLADFNAWPGALNTTAVLLGTLVHPSARGNNLQLLVHQVRIQLAQQQGRTGILGETSAENVFSWPNALRAGAYIVSTGVDPDDGCKLFNYRFSQDKMPVLTQEAPQALSPVTQFNTISQMLNSGQAVGVGITADKSILVQTHQGWTTKPGARKAYVLHPAAGVAA